ncbi:MAG TPA: ACP S-malonyltransferase [Frankiaceae bacterium]|nr:ACP S-malonyltransferase [Frankiaceae bacterium]
MLAIVAPGQGAQTPGFLAPWLEVAAAAELLRRADDVTGLDLVRLGSSGDAEEIRDTAVAQPLLVAVALASAAALDLLPAEGAASDAAEDRLFAGHSIGELTAAVLAGALPADAALVLARERGRAMAEACAAADTGMTAVLGGDPLEVDAALDLHGLVAANRNGAGQVVAAGPRAGLLALAADPPAKARLRPLDVAGAFHTEAMRPAQQALAEVVAGLDPHDPAGHLLSNADGAVVRSGTDLLERLVAQVAAPVRWDSCMATMAGSGVAAVLELAPGGTLTGLAKRALKGVDTVALRGPGDLDAARLLLKRAGEGTS